MSKKEPLKRVKIEEIKNPEFLQGLNYKELALLSTDITDYIVDKVSVNGGHLAANLGVVDATIALCRSFDFSKDKIIFDVGHQCYTYKILTGRSLERLRQKDGVCGFQRIEESPYDHFEAGHSSTSISAATGMAFARDLKGEKYDIVAFIGDSSIQNGLAFEGLNNLAQSNHKVIIVEEEAKVVRRIYREFLTGSSLNEIARGLEKDGIKSPWGRDRWYYTTVKSILQNEKYYGAVLMNKTFKPDVLSKKRYKNEGQVEAYYAENVIPPIIDKKTFEMVQYEMKEREKRRKTQEAYSRHCVKYAFSKKLICGCCGSFMVRCNNMRENGKRIPSWWCSDRRHGGECRQSAIAEYKIENAFIEMLNTLITNTKDLKDIIKISAGSVLIPDGSNNIETLELKIEEMQEEMMELHKKRVNGLISETEYSIKGGRLAKKIDDTKKEKEAIADTSASNSIASSRLEELYQIVDEIDVLNQFDGEIFKRLIDYVAINGKRLIFHFKVGFDKIVEL